MDVHDESISWHGDDGKRVNPLAALWMTPVFPKPGDSEGRAVLHGDSIRTWIAQWYRSGKNLSLVADNFGKEAVCLL